MSHGRTHVVGVPDAGGDGSRPRRKRGGRSSGAQGELLPESARFQLATGFDEGGRAPSSRRFVDEEPAGDFVWLFFNRDGTVSEYETELVSYLRYRAQYGIPATRWRPSSPHKSNGSEEP